ncbi:MAG: BlaI/MecI/CopY family transcriptional regulator [Acidobacteriota bacterium]
MSAAKLSRREREIMDVLYALGDNATAEEIREKLSEPPSYSAARAMLAKLEAKGAIKHRAEGLRYVYSPVTSRSSAQKKAVSNLMRVFFSGSASQAATALLKQESWSDDELAALRDQIEHVRKQRRK